MDPYYLSDIRERILKYEEVRTSPLDFYRDYTKELLNEFKNVFIFNDAGKKKKVAIFFGNPERAIAKIKEARNLVLPTMSLSIMDIEEDIDRRKPNFNLSVRTDYDKKKRRARRIASLAPKAVNLTYSLNIWAKYVEDINQIVEEVQTRFHPYLKVSVNTDESTPAFMQSLSENSSMSVGDKQDRILRKTATFQLECYVPAREYVITSNGDIEIFGADVEIVDSPVELKIHDGGGGFGREIYETAPVKLGADETEPTDK